jgi:hypothetical protein
MRSRRTGHASQSSIPPAHLPQESQARSESFCPTLGSWQAKGHHAWPARLHRSQGQVRSRLRGDSRQRGQASSSGSFRQSDSRKRPRTLLDLRRELLSLPGRDNETRAEQLSSCLDPPQGTLRRHPGQRLRPQAIEAGPGSDDRPRLVQARGQPHGDPDRHGVPLAGVGRTGEGWNVPRTENGQGRPRGGSSRSRRSAARARGGPVFTPSPKLRVISSTDRQRKAYEDWARGVLERARI